jgi:lysine-N-methylase
MRLTLPQNQNYSCHGCGGCCWLYEVVLTEQERQRIIEQNWTPADGIPAGTRLFRRIGGPFSRRWCLARRPDGACIFLNEKGLCRIHARFGEPAKPLVCRLFPFVLYPAGDSTAVSLRFSCPSVAGSRGIPISERRGEIEEFCRLGATADAPNPPPISRKQQLDWPDTLRIVTALHGMFAADAGDETPLALRVIHALFVAEMIGQATFDKVRGDRLGELMDTLISAAPAETTTDLEEVDAPLAAARVQLRMLVAQYAPRHPLTVVGLRYRAAAAAARVRMTRGQGMTPQLHPGLPPVAFDDLERDRGCSSPEIDALFARYFQGRLQGMSFCGRACYGLNVSEGFMRLMLTYPVLLYLTRWSTIGQGRESATAADAELAVTLVDHKHGYSPLLGSRSVARMARWLAQNAQVKYLSAWYAR